MKQTLLVTILFLVPIPLAGRELPAAAAQNPAPIDVTGKWTFEVTTSAGSGMPTVTFKQSGDTLTGHYSGHPAVHLRQVKTGVFTAPCGWA